MKKWFKGLSGRNKVIVVAVALLVIFAVAGALSGTMP